MGKSIGTVVEEVASPNATALEEVASSDATALEEVASSDATHQTSYYSKWITPQGAKVRRKKEVRHD
jgi:hypothetical protein